MLPGGQGAGMNGIAVAECLGIIQSSASNAVRREERLAHTNHWKLDS